MNNAQDRTNAGFNDLFMKKVYVGRWGDSAETARKVGERLEEEGYAYHISEKKEENVNVRAKSARGENYDALVYYALEAYPKDASRNAFSILTPRASLHLRRSKKNDLHACAATNLTVRFALRLLMLEAFNLVLLFFGVEDAWPLAVFMLACGFQTLREYFLSRKLFKWTKEALSEIQTAKTNKKNWLGWRRASV